ncbi:MAG: cytochrome-c peroxidase [Tannerellaceae bacterium]|nr:cytochrome-c peroxidase [Tannerellaceae bacterium]
MNKLTGLSFLVGTTLLLSSCGNKEYKEYEGDKARQVASIIRNNGCLECHSSEAKLPFYGNFPVIGSTVKADIQDGTRYINLDHLLEALDNGEVPSQVDMAKVEHTALSGSMPPVKYVAIHWGSNLSSEEKGVILSWAKEVRAEHYASPTVAAQFANEPVQPLPLALPTDPEKVALGFTLYHDTRLSADNTLSCASCHDLGTAGVDRKQFSEGINGQFGGVNAPTVYNAALNTLQFWDGRAADLQEQAAGPPLNPVEMGHISFDDIVDLLVEDTELVKIFEQLYPQEGVTESTITDAIAEFEKTLLTPSRFDYYLRGDLTAMTPEELQGYEVFKEKRCATCHVGMNMGGQSFEYMGIKADYFGHRGTDITDGDLGRFAFTSNEDDKHRFKTPTLRNVMLTYPYFHDGTIMTIEDAIRVMHRFQLGGEINDKETQQIATYLHTLTGEYQGEILQ